MDNNISPNLLIAKKTEKIVTAVYLISQFLPDTENLKLELRDTANQLVKEVNLFAYDNTDNIFSLYKDALDKVSLLIIYLTLAKNSSLISKMNTEIVIAGLRSLENILVKEQFKFNQENLKIIEEDLFFNLEREIGDNNLTNPNTTYDVLTNRNLGYEKEKGKVIKDISNYKGQIENINYINEIIKDNNSNSTLKAGAKNIKSSNQNAKYNQDKSKSLTKTNLKKPIFKRNTKIKENRKEQILNAFSHGVEVSINDLAKKIIGCSVKTIQRELNNLLEEGKIEKIGEKRWSRYKLV